MAIFRQKCRVFNNYGITTAFYKKIRQVHKNTEKIALLRRSDPVKRLRRQSRRKEIHLPIAATAVKIRKVNKNKIVLRENYDPCQHLHQYFSGGVASRGPSATAETLVTIN